MAHTYASVAQFKKFLTDGGSDYGTANDALLLTLLESSSRRIDEWCDRSAYGSGFGPRTASNVYDTDGEGTVDLDDDFLSFSAVTMLDSTGGSSTSLTETTDYYAQPYGRSQKRRITLNGLTHSAFGSGLRTLTVAGVAGYSNTTVAGTATMGTASAAALSLTPSAMTEFSAGMTLLVGTEQIYVSGTASTTLTVLRGQNGTTAAIISAGAAIAWYTYPAEVTETTMRVAQRRIRSRDAGLTASFGGGDMPATSFADTENAILRAGVGHLRRYAVA